jgi:GntR family transcriptional repressor for pyruvate dehydrogenase complex
VSSPFQPKVVDASSAADQVEGQLRAAMVAGTLRPGDRLSTEPALATEFGVSRATIREAIRGLRSHGLLTTTRGARGGHFVISPRTEVLAARVGETFGLWFDSGDVTVAEVDEAREVVEMACVKYAAERRTDRDLAEMRDLIAHAARPEIPLAEFFEVNLQFHHAIAKAARNRILELPMVAVHLVRSRTNSLIRHHKRRPAVQQHRAILAAIAAQDPVQAQTAFAAHMRFLIGQRDAAIAPLHRTAAEIVLNEIADEGAEAGLDVDGRQAD